MARRLLVVEDDKLLRQSLKHRLMKEGYAVMAAQDGQEALMCARADRPDLVLLDIGLPDRSGLDIARVLHTELHLPIIFLTARSQETDIVVGLELGAEDYITKPFGMRELLARIRVVLRRSEHSDAAGREELLRAADVTLDARQHKVWVRGGEIDLPPKEFELLRLLMANAGTVLTSDYLLDAVWGEEFAGTLQVLYVHIGWLREQIEVDARQPRLIQTVRGVGYRFAAEV
jgi:two-component system response regulator RegX3